MIMYPTHFQTSNRLQHRYGTFNPSEGPIPIYCLRPDTPFRELTKGPSRVQKCKRSRDTRPFEFICAHRNWLICESAITPACTPGCARGKDKHMSVKGAVCLFYYLYLVVGPFYYPSRIHRWHEHHEQDVRNYRLWPRCR